MTGTTVLELRNAVMEVPSWWFDVSGHACHACLTGIAADDLAHESR